MKVSVLNKQGKKSGKITLPQVFGETFRPDLIRRSFVAEISSTRQSYGVSHEAGRRASASGKIRHRRRKWKTAYGYGISRIPRKVHTRRGSRFFWRGAFVPGTVGGRRAHPPKAEKSFVVKLNKKEREKALKSAIAATGLKEIVTKRYGKVKADGLPELPIIVKKLEEIQKIKELQALLESVGILGFIGKKKVRSGGGKLRGRKYKRNAGPIVVVSDKKRLVKTKNLGVDIVSVKELCVKDLAPGGQAGRLTVYSAQALEELPKKFGGTKK